MPENDEPKVDDATSGTDGGAAVVDGPDPEGSDALGDAGKKALNTMKAERNEERAKRRELEAELAKLKAEPAPQVPDVDAIRRDVLSTANKRILRSEVKAAAAGKLSDANDALKFLDLDQFGVSDDGDVTGDIPAAIDALIADKPYLAAKATRFQGTGDGGAQRKASGPTQLTREELKGMKPEAIAKAKAEGRLNDLLGHK